MDIDVLFFGPARDLAGTDRASFQVSEGTTIGTLRRMIHERFDDLAPALKTVRFAVNECFATLDTVLHNGDEVALIPPVSGGVAEDDVWVDLLKKPIDAVRVRAFVTGDPRAGGIVVFEGATRRDVDPVHGAIQRLDYVAYDAMAQRHLDHLAREAKGRWSLHRVAVIHRVGSVPPGESSVMIAVACGHRAEAFEAGRWLIDAIKQDVPIWKKDIYEDGHERWVRPSAKRP